MLYEITYDYTQTVGGQARSYRNNVVGREKGTRRPVGYGPNGPPARFGLNEIETMMHDLRTQLVTDDIILHIHPYYPQDR